MMTERRMTQAEKRAKATPILKAAILAGKSMADAAELAGISVNTAFSYRHRAEEVEGATWGEQLDGELAKGEAPVIRELADIIARRLKWLASREPDDDDLVAYSDSLAKLGAVHDRLLERIERAADRANDPASLLRGLDGFAQWLRREFEASRLGEEDLRMVRDLVARYTADLQAGRFEVSP